MDELLQELCRQTLETARKIDELTPDDLSEFVERRGAIVEQIRQAMPEEGPREEHRKLVESLLKLDPLVASKIEEYKSEAGQVLKKLNAAKQQRNLYDADPSNYADSFFIDRKK